MGGFPILSPHTPHTDFLWCMQSSGTMSSAGGFSCKYKLLLPQNSGEENLHISMKVLLLFTL